MSSVSNSVSQRAVAKQDLFRCNSEAIIIQIGEKTCALLRRFLDALVFDISVAADHFGNPR